VTLTTLRQGSQNEYPDDLAELLGDQGIQVDKPEV
jgi:hypothetical protein